jgi:hypothetical protein
MKNHIRALTVAIAAIFALTLTAFANDPTGTWKFKAEIADGRSVESTVTLKWENNQLSGTVENRLGRTSISDGRFVDDQVTFTVVRKIGRRLRKKKFTINYAGRLEGDAIKGTIQTIGRDKNPVSLAWDAQRVK